MRSRETISGRGKTKSWEVGYPREADGGDIGGDSHTTRWCRSVFVYRVIIVFEEGIGWRRTAHRLRVVRRSPIFGFDGGIPEAF